MLLDLEWLGALTWLLALLTHLVLLFALWAAGDEDDHAGFDAEQVRRNRGR